jgi:magnesium chelatase accessory protein
MSMSDDSTLLQRLEAAQWPHRKNSRLIAAGGLNWHVQQMGSGPLCLLLHGTGASTHSFRDFAPALAAHFTVVMPDLPGHGFTQTPDQSGMTLPGMSRLLGDLLAALSVAPVLAIGHSAGAAVLARMSIDHRFSPSLIIALNGALLPFSGLARHVFPALARAAFLNPFTPQIFAWRAKDRTAVERVLTNTGSTIDDAGLDQYAHLFRDSVHVAATLRMMARWDLVSLEADLPRLQSPLVLLATAEDRAVPQDAAFTVRDLVKGAEVVYLKRLGHLAHEEDPSGIAAVVLEQARRRHVLLATTGSDGASI